MNLVVKVCRWFDGFVIKLSDFALVLLPAIVMILGAFIVVFHVLAYIIGIIL